MQFALVAILFAVFVAATIAFAVIAFLHRRRVGALSRVANQWGLRFSSDDPFDVPRFYADFVPVASGHSARARNVTYGQWHGIPIRAFDFRYEAGHGMQRHTRNFVVAVVQLERPLPPVLMWNTMDSICSPLEAIRCVEKFGPWMCRGEDALIRALALALAPLEHDAICIQTRGDQVMLWQPAGRGGRMHAPLMECSLAAAEILDAWAGAASAEPVDSEAEA